METHQNFELVELLFREQSTEFESFKERFQSLINQIPSYLHSVNKPGFFNHFFLGIFSTLLDTELKEKIGINDIYYFLGDIYLKIIVKTNGKTHVFIFNEKTEESKREESDEFITRNFNFNKNELKKLNSDIRKLTLIKENNIKENNIKISLITIKDNIVDLYDKKLCDNEISYDYVSFKQIFPIKINECNLNYNIENLSKNYPLLVEKSIREILKYVKKLHTALELPEGNEAKHHGFLFGILNNFKYHYNTKTYPEQFFGKGYADIVLLVRGFYRTLNAIPIIIELKAGNARGTEASSALQQAEGYALGYQPNKIRFLTRSKNVICVGLNLDKEEAHVTKTSIQSYDQKTVQPLIEKILTEISIWNGEEANENELKDKIKKFILSECYSFPPTKEKKEPFYFSYFLLLGQVMPLSQHLGINLKKYVQSNISQKQEGLRGSHNVTTVALIPVENKKPVFLISVIESGINDEIKLSKFPSNKFKEIGIEEGRKLIELVFQINVNEELIQCININSIKKYSSLKDYNQSKNHLNTFFEGEFKFFGDNAIDLKEKFDIAIASQKNHSEDQPTFSSEAYTGFFLKISEGIFPFKSLIKSESNVQAVLHGFFNYYSDLKLEETPENIELVLTEFQIGGGGRIDMMIQGIGDSPQGSKEYIPVGLELKYGSLSGKKKIYLHNQMDRYEHGAAIKAITESTKVVIMGIAFNEKSSDPTTLFEVIEPQGCGIVTHSSIFSMEKQSCIFPVSNLSQAMSSTPDLTPIPSTINVNLLPRQPRPNISGIPGTSRR